MTEQQQPTFWTTGWLPNGVKVSYTVPFDWHKGYEEALEFTNELLAKGFTTSEPGLGAGEKKDKVGYVLRRSVVNERGETPVIDVYVDHEAMTWRTVKVYLNTPEQVADFEHVSGLKLDALPYYEGKDSIERGDAKLGKYVIPVKNVFYAVAKTNPKHEEEQDAEKRKLIPKRLFVRWETGTGSTAPNTPPDAPQAPNAPSMATSSIDDSDTTWVTRQDAVTAFCSAVVTYFAQQRIKVTAADIFGAINIVTQQSAARFGEFVNTTQADAWASVLFQMSNHNKANALVQVKGDAVLIKAIEFWANQTEDIKF